MSHPPAERLQKLLSAAGLGSRREIEGWIRDGRVTVNNQPAQLGDKATAADRVKIDGRPVRLDAEAGPRRVIAYHKPEGEITTRDDPEGRPTVFENLPRLRRARWISIGRLDVNTSGLLLFTTDGELAHRVMHPSTELTRRYAVRVLGEVEEEVLAQLRKGVQLDDGLAQAASVEAAGGSGANRWYHLTLREGRNREVRRMWESQGLTVSRLIRIGYGPIELGRSLPRGKWRELTDGEMKALYTSAGLRPPQADSAGPDRKRRRGGGERKSRSSATGSRRSRR
ncbi:MAG TPA: pseudouridine synthase [Gammaproteobacteria bacterium]|nr:pseudouridine synthase [Gammaproteobacteria bacterium]